MDMSVDMRTIFNNLPEEKRREVAAKIVHEQVENPMMHTVVVMPEPDEDGEIDPSKIPTASGLNMKNIVEEYGEDYAIEMMLHLLTSGAVTTKVMDGDSISKLMERCAKGEGSPEDYAMANMVISQLKQQHGFGRDDVTVICTRTLLDLLHYAKTAKGIQSYFSDVMTSLFMLMLGSMVLTPDTPMYRFRNCSPHQSIDMAEKIGQDIEKALDDSIFKGGKPNNQFLALAYYALSQKYATMNEEADKMTFADAPALADLFGLEQEFEDYSKKDNEEENSEEED